jgi:hypothetical protein
MAEISPFPLFPPLATSVYMDSLDPAVFTKDPRSNLWSFVNALVGKAGAGSLVNEIFLSNLSAALDTCYFSELDYIVGNIRFMARTSAESYTYDPHADMLTSDQWDEVKIKDAWFRARIKEFFAACQLGGTPEGIRKVVSAAIATDCTIEEVWRYVDNFGFDPNVKLGRAGSGANTWVATNLSTGYSVMFSTVQAANDFRLAQTDNWEVNAVRPRNEVVIKPHKTSLTPVESRILRETLNRILPMETIVTVDVRGLAVSTPVSVSGAAADDSYYEVVKQAIPSPLVSQMPAPEFLAMELLPGEQWLFSPSSSQRKTLFNELLAAATSGTQPINESGLTDAVVKAISEVASKRTLQSVAQARKIYNEEYGKPFSELLEFLNGDSEKREAPYAAFMQTSQHSYYYLLGDQSVIDSVTYGTLQSDGSVKKEQNHQLYQQNSSYSGWTNYEKADSPDNYPGGRFGRHPGYEPAINPDGTDYIFSYASQSAFVSEMIQKVEEMGGIANSDRYRLPIQKNQTVVYTFYPENAIASSAPTKESTVSASATRRRSRKMGRSTGDTNNFVR